MVYRLKELRKKEGLTQEQMANILGTNQSQYGKYENEKTKLNLENAKKLAKYFNVSVAYLLGLEGQKQSYEANEMNLTEQMDVPLFNPYLELMKKTVAILVDENGEYEELARFYGWSETEFEGKKAYKINEKKDEE
ncbi:helix-turn-helix domain-containing protein [Streptococcus anginosus]|uniref:helix-turn-helix domain-containing protein n=1 Tax=Streptococcus anginosus TaxID=1328 RepID=UPI00039196FA|nr:helix-turn-helix transcriptional regulator [Streptococcus anginosus]MED5860202.1 helix-turn-helix transcriptional regulator [Streptococcus anginosus]MED5873914.1 helix-turn-helix transcriptional regulator [Streptococcus anginosus]GAD41583.1 hypothetical protein ANG4_0177 [Streptococcus anginosus 1505]